MQGQGGEWHARRCRGEGRDVQASGSVLSEMVKWEGHIQMWVLKLLLCSVLNRI